MTSEAFEKTAEVMATLRPHSLSEVSGATLVANTDRIDCPAFSPSDPRSNSKMQKDEEGVRTTKSLKLANKSMSMSDVTTFVRVKKNRHNNGSFNGHAQHHAAHRRYEVHYERLPKNCPYVGTFHRGYSPLSKGPVRTYDVDKERLPANNPYLGNFHRGNADALKRTSPSIRAQIPLTVSLPNLPEMLLPPPLRVDNMEEAFKNVARSAPSTAEAGPMKVVDPGFRSDSGLSRSITPPTSLSIFELMDDAKQRACPWVESDESDEEEGELMSIKDCLSIPDSVPKNPELCGLQSILPRQCGVRVLDKIGEGSFAKVVLAINNRNCTAFDPELERNKKDIQRRISVTPRVGDRIVLKCIRKDKNCMGEDGLECIQREVKIHQTIMHPNIPIMYGSYEDDAFVTLILGFVEGRELQCALDQRKMFGEVETKVLCMQLMSALEYLHQHHICHRDVTPRNILIAANGGATLIDLGLAVDIRDASNAPVTAGTMGYMAPETLTSDGTTGIMCVSDVFSLGAIMYQMVLGFQPFLSYEIMTPSPVEFPDASWGPSVISDTLMWLLRDMLHKDPAKRITSAAALAHEWFDAACKVAVEKILAAKPKVGETQILETPDPTPPSTPTTRPADKALTRNFSEKELSALMKDSQQQPPHLKSNMKRSESAKHLRRQSFDECCVKVDAKSHKSTENGSHHIFYARVINMPVGCCAANVPPGCIESPPESPERTRSPDSGLGTRPRSAPHTPVCSDEVVTQEGLAFGGEGLKMPMACADSFHAQMLPPLVI